MNIIIDDVLFHAIMQRNILSVKVGSHLYGLENEKSDTDIMSIFLMNDRELQTLMANTFHQLQYKTRNGDYLFTSLQGFFRNILTGGSTICFEALHTDYFQDQFKLNVKDFYNFNIIKAYLGLAKRDLERLHKLSSLYDKRKCLAHVYRGYLFAKEIMEGRTLRLRIDEYDESIQNNFKTIRDFERKWESGDDDVVDFLFAKVMDLRAVAVKNLQDGQLFLYMDPIKQKDLDDKLYDFAKDRANKFHIDLSSNLDLQIVRQVLESGIKY